MRDVPRHPTLMQSIHQQHEWQLTIQETLPPWFKCIHLQIHWTCYRKLACHEFKNDWQWNIHYNKVNSIREAYIKWKSNVVILRQRRPETSRFWSSCWKWSSWSPRGPCDDHYHLSNLPSFPIWAKFGVTLVSGSKVFSVCAKTELSAKKSLALRKFCRFLPISLWRSFLCLYLTQLINKHVNRIFAAIP